VQRQAGNTGVIGVAGQKIALGRIDAVCDAPETSIGSSWSRARG
jgi:hypothetical protein